MPRMRANGDLSSGGRFADVRTASVPAYQPAETFITQSGLFERVDEMNIKAPTATSKCQLTTSEDAWVVLATAILPGYRVKVHKCTSLWLVLYLATVI